MTAVIPRRRHPWHQILRAAPPYAAAAEAPDDDAGVLVRHRGTAHGGAARCAIALGQLENAAVAERLFISPRTAAVHVSNILAKLSMSSRTEVAPWAVRKGLLADP